jgi:hypothetical protein
VALDGFGFAAAVGRWLVEMDASSLHKQAAVANGLATPAVFYSEGSKVAGCKRAKETTTSPSLALFPISPPSMAQRLGSAEKDQQASSKQSQAVDAQ